MDQILCDQTFIKDSLLHRNDSYFIRVAKRGTARDACAHLCGSSTTPVQDKPSFWSFAAASVVSFLRIDALSNIINKATFPIPNLQDSVKEEEDNTNRKILDYDGGRAILGPVSPEFISALLDDEERNNNDSPSLNTGAVVSLVGRAAFPCVCEVTHESSSLFTDESSSVIAEGVKWQSLYLVMMGRYLLLAEPERRGCGGNGRVVTSCLLSCLSTEKDDPSTVHSSPARRLIITHTSFDSTPPGVFTLDTVEGAAGITYTSRMDLWFEDEDAADSAYEALFLKICKAKSRRGKQICELFSREL